MPEGPFPDFGALLAPFITQVPDEDRPRFLALLERGAAARYRAWSEELAEHAGPLLACARREDEIADRIERTFAIDPAVLARAEAALPGARDVYYAVFRGLPVGEQLRVQAEAERQGAAAWRRIAGRVSDPAILAELAACSALEEESARVVDGLVAAIAGAAPV